MNKYDESLHPLIPVSDFEKLMICEAACTQHRRELTQLKKHYEDRLKSFEKNYHKDLQNIIKQLRAKIPEAKATNEDLIKARKFDQILRVLNLARLNTISEKKLSNILWDQIVKLNKKSPEKTAHINPDVP